MKFAEVRPDGVYVDDEKLEKGEPIEFKIGAGWWLWARFGEAEGGYVVVWLTVEVAHQGDTAMGEARVSLPPWALLRRLSK